MEVFQKSNLKLAPLVSFWLWGFLLIIFAVTSAVADQQTPTTRERNYPDVWYRTYDWPTQVCDKIFSDKKIWGDEPVLILCREGKREGIAEGFFSGKRYRISIHRVQGVMTYRYKHNNKPMQERGTIPPKDFISDVKLSDGMQIKYEQEYGLGWDRDAASDRKGISPLINPYACEPILKSLARYNREGKLVWAKSVVRYYPKGERPPPHADGEGICGGYEAWLSDGAEIQPLILADASLLVSGYPFTYVVRIRGEDGGSGALPPMLRVIDRQALRDAKEELVQRYLVKIRRVVPNIKEVLEFDSNKSPDLPAIEYPYRKEGRALSNLRREFGDPERLYRQLASYFFEDTQEQGDTK